MALLVQGGAKAPATHIYDLDVGEEKGTRKGAKGDSPVISREGWKLHHDALFTHRWPELKSHAELQGSGNVVFILGSSVPS